MDEKTLHMIREAEEEARDAERTVKDQILELEREIEVADRRNAALNDRLTDALDRAMQAERSARIYAERAERAEAEVERLKSELNALSNYIMDDEIISVLALAPSDLGPITQESLLPDVMPPLGRRTIEIMERKIAPSNNDLLSDGLEEK